MNERRREAALLGRRLARHRRWQARTAVALVELERRPGYRLLDAATHGRTAERCAAARTTRDRLWRDWHAALISDDDGGWAVVDLGSRNRTAVGTYDIVAAHRPVQIPPGTVVRLGLWTSVLIEPAA